MRVPRISVVVPIYNVEAYLAECLESLAGQTVRDLEIIMVDDGSTDGSAAIAERFADGRVHEDIPVVLPAHFMARSVDVVSEPVYYYRVRESGDKSITQRRLELKVLLDRLAAVEEVHDYLLRNGPRQARRW